MGKKTKVVEEWTTVEKVQKCVVLKRKLEELQLRTVYVNEMADLDSIIQKYIKHDQEYTGSIPLPGTQRIMVIKFRNSKKWDPAVELVFNPRAGKSN